MEKFDCPNCHVSSPSPVILIDEEVVKANKENDKRVAEYQEQFNQHEKCEKCREDWLRGELDLAKAMKRPKQIIEFLEGKLYKPFISWVNYPFLGMMAYNPPNYIECPACHKKHYFWAKAKAS
jgi:ferredoxin